MSENLQSRRVKELIECILNAAAGDLSAFFVPSEKNDYVDSIGVAFNSFIEEARHERETREKELLTWRRAMHDIRGPIGSIGQLVSSIEQVTAAENSDILFRRQVAEAVRNSCTLMLGKINDALQNYKAGHIEPKRIQVRESVEQALEILMLPIVDKNFEIVVRQKEDFLLYSDPNLIQSVFKNLIENAWKYRKPGIKGRLEITAQTEGDVSVISFKDNGIGIQQPNLEKVFQVFARVSNNADGVGYGLYSVKRDVETLGGHILLQSEPDKGTVFELRLKNKTDLRIWEKLIPVP